MPSREEHMLNDIRSWGLKESFPEVHRILDQFAHYPNMRFLSLHRRYLHHAEGIEYIEMRFGADAGIAAYGHIMDDCGHIPNAIDYYRGSVDNFGFKIAGR